MRRKFNILSLPLYTSVVQVFRTRHFFHIEQAAIFKVGVLRHPAYHPIYQHVAKVTLLRWHGMKGLEVRARAVGIEARSRPKCHLHIHAHNRPLHGERVNLFLCLSLSLSLASCAKHLLPVFLLPSLFILKLSVTARTYAINLSIEIDHLRLNLRILLNLFYKTQSFILLRG